MSQMQQQQPPPKEDKRDTITVKKKGDTLAFLERKDPLRTNANLYVPSNSNPFMVATNSINTNAFAKATTVNTLSSILSTISKGLSSLIDVGTQTLAISNIAPSGANVNDPTLDTSRSVTIKLASTINLLSPGNDDGKIFMDTRYYEFKIRSTMLMWGPSVYISSALSTNSLTTGQLGVTTMGVRTMTFSTLTGNTNSIINVSTLNAASNISTLYISSASSVFNSAAMEYINCSSLITGYASCSTILGSTLTVSTLNTISTGEISILTANSLTVHSTVSASSLTVTGYTILNTTNIVNLSSINISTNSVNAISSIMTQLSTTNAVVQNSLTASLISTTSVSSVSGNFETSLDCSATTTTQTLRAKNIITSSLQVRDNTTAPLIYTTQLHHVSASPTDPITFDMLSGSYISTLNLSTIHLNNNIADHTEGYFSTLYTDNVILNHIVPNTLGSTITFEKLSGDSISTVSLSTVTLNNNITDVTTCYFNTMYTDTSIMNHIEPNIVGGEVTFENLTGDSISHVSTLNSNLTDETNGYFSTFHSNTLYTTVLSTPTVVTSGFQPINVANPITFNKLSGSYLSTSNLSTANISIGDTNTANVFGDNTCYYIPNVTQIPAGSELNSLRIMINGVLWLIPLQKA
jgi:hypothetical protein